MVLVVKVTVAMPLELVLLDVTLSDPPDPVLDQLTVLPEIRRAFPLESASWAEMVTPVPATGLELLEVTRYLEATL